MARTICYLLFAIFLGSSPSFGAGPLPVVYAEDTDEGGGREDLQQSYIDNQSYLREVEQQLRERALHPPPPAPVVVIRKSVRSQSFTPFTYPYYRNKESDSFLGVEVHGGATSILYYDGYQPHCCWPRDYDRPAPPVAVPYRSSAGSRRR